mmetsp:Transcript_24748/g.30168  ORF Transcript_24748/g.30168 Transcript_24748/m.30168 type:complete len:137 (-) Transcript_24748:32-442(-)
MVKFMKRGRVVLVLQGRYAGCKATILNVHEKSSKFKFAHIVVAGISRAPKKITRKMTEEQKKKKSKVRAFVKVLNQAHVMPTRYKLKLNMESVDAKKISTPDAKQEIKKTIQKKFQKIYMTTGRPQMRWFFKKLYI